MIPDESVFNKVQEGTKRANSPVLHYLGGHQLTLGQGKALKIKSGLSNRALRMNPYMQETTLIKISLPAISMFNVDGNHWKLDFRMLIYH